MSLPFFSPAFFKEESLAKNLDSLGLCVHYWYIVGGDVLGAPFCKETTLLLVSANNIKRVIPSVVEESRYYCVEIMRSFDYGGKPASAQDDRYWLFAQTLLDR